MSTPIKPPCKIWLPLNVILKRNITTEITAKALRPSI